MSGGVTPYNSTFAMIAWVWDIWYRAQHLLTDQRKVQNDGD